VHLPTPDAVHMADGPGKQEGVSRHRFAPSSSSARTHIFFFFSFLCVSLFSIPSPLSPTSPCPCPSPPPPSCPQPSQVRADSTLFPSHGGVPDHDCRRSIPRHGARVPLLKSSFRGAGLFYPPAAQAPAGQVPLDVRQLSPPQGQVRPGEGQLFTMSRLGGEVRLRHLTAQGQAQERSRCRCRPPHYEAGPPRGARPS